MADVTLARAGSAVLVDLDVCVKTGVSTNNRVTLRGHTTPAWVTLLLLFSIIGFLIAGSMTSRRYRVTIPFSRPVHDRWRSNKALAWLAGLAGAGALVASLSVGGDPASLLVGGGVVLLGGGAAIGAWNAWTNNVGIHVSHDGDLVLTRAHPAFAKAVRTASIEKLSPRQ